MFKKFMIWTVSCAMWCLSPLAVEAVTVSNASQLAGAISSANGGGDKTIALSDGVYSLGQMLHVTADGVTVYGASGNREAVILEGKGMSGGVSHIFLVAASNFTVRDLTLRKVANHAIQIQGENNADSPVIRNVHILDTGTGTAREVLNDDLLPNSPMDHFVVRGWSRDGARLLVGLQDGSTTGSGRCGSPTTTWNRVTPKLYRSLAADAALPSRSSGAR